MESLPSITEVSAELCRRDLRQFTRDSWHEIEHDDLEWGWYLDCLCDHLTYVYLGDIKNLIISIPPRFLKSTLTSVIWPAWCWSNDPKLKFLTGSYEIGLATRDALRMRDLLQSPWYRERFGTGTMLRADQNEKNLFINESGGMRMAVSVGGRLTGFGGDIILTDDPHNLVEIHQDVKRIRAINWYKGPLRTRVNKASTARRVLIAQRGKENDLTGYLLEQGKYTHVCLANEFNPLKRCRTVNPKTKQQIFVDPRTKEGELLCPQRLDQEATDSLKADMSNADYQAQFNQDPTTDGGLILKENWWRPWVNPPWRPNAGKPRELPECFQIIQVYDTAFEEDEVNDYSARITLGLFRHQEERIEKVRKPDGTYIDAPIKLAPRNCAIILGAWRDKIGFPDLRKEAKLAYNKIKPDWVLIEKKASGHALIKELRKAGVPIKAVKIDGDGDKIARANVATLPLEKGCLWYLPDMASARMVIDECKAFPNGAHDDWVDCILMALMWLRRADGVSFQEEADQIRLFRPMQRKGISTG